MSAETSRQPDCEYVVVGSGAGGGTLAARLAEAGRRVILLEAGGDPRSLSGGDAIDTANRLPDDYDVPVFHALSSENMAMKWDFFVRHYANEEQQKRDDKYVAAKGGVLYPRAGTLGGCTAHNAQIMVYPHNADWDYLAQLTGDPSWGAEKMRRYFERLENCHHQPLYRALSKIGINPTKHGWNGWLQTEAAIPKTALGDKDLDVWLLESALKAFVECGHPVEEIKSIFESGADPNDWRRVPNNGVGICYTPLTTHGHQRMAARERVLEAAKQHPEFLKIEMNALATRVLFDEGNRAIGVEYFKGDGLYRASGRPGGGAGERRELRASREVILAGGAFNTPQLLMLSGIGPQDDLRRVGIEPRVNLRGVGQNLQDRYEVGVVNRMNFEAWEILRGGEIREGRSAVSAMGKRTRRRVHDKRRGAGGDQAVGERAAAAGSFLLRAGRPVPRILSGLFGAVSEAPELPDVGDSEGAHE